MKPQRAKFGALSAADRLKLFRALHAQMAEAVAAGCDFLLRATYQSNYERRPFRAPHDPAATLARRFEFAEAWANACGEHDQPLAWHAAKRCSDASFSSTC